MNKIVKVVTITSFISTSLLICGFEQYDYSGTICDKSLMSNQNSAQSSWNIRLCSYAKAHNISIEKARYRLDIMDSTYKITSDIRGYFGNELSGMFFGEQNGKFGLNIRTSRKGGMTTQDKVLIEQVKKESGVPLNIIFNTTHNTAQMDSYLTRVNDMNLIDIINAHNMIQYNIEYDVTNDIIELTIYTSDINKNLSKDDFSKRMQEFRQHTQNNPAYIKLKKYIESNPFCLKVKTVYSTFPTVD